MVPAVTVVVSDFGQGQPSWDRLRSCLSAVAEQDTVHPYEVVLCESPALFGSVPHDIRELVLGLRVLKCDASEPHVRKSFGVENAWAPIVALLDADCVPRRDWLSRMLETFRYYPEVAAVHGRMVVEGLGWLGRLWSGPETRQAGPSRSTGTNNVAFRKEAYLEYPLAEGSGGQAARRQSEAMLRARYVLWEEPGMQVLRDVPGVLQRWRALGQPAAATR